MPSHHDLLTLALAETTQNEFTVIAANARREYCQQIYQLNLTREEIIRNGVPIWDLGQVTRVYGLPEKPKEDKCHNQHYENLGRCVLLQNIEKQQLQNRLNLMKIDYESFLKKENNQYIRFAVVQPRRVNQISFGPAVDGHSKCFVTFDFDNNHRNERLLVKDFRWVNYWDHVKRSDLEGKEDFYVELLNRRDLKLYLIMYRRIFPSNSNYWVSGLHLL